jgi:hypothetical protein
MLINENNASNRLAGEKLGLYENERYLSPFK